MTALKSTPLVQENHISKHKMDQFQVIPGVTLC
jgi:hypothetical protein